MRINTKGSVRLIMPSGAFDIDAVRRVVIGKIQDPNTEFPKYYFRSIRIETEEGSIEIMMESSSERALQMEHEGSILGSLKKQVMG